MASQVEDPIPRALASTPSSSTSGCLSGDDTSEDRLLPSSLAAEELQLALNKVNIYLIQFKIVVITSRL